jgi:parvulin-like peptidyl-prolyl isomerase
MKSAKVKLWDEELTFSKAFAKLCDQEAQNYVLKELTKRLLFQRSFAEYNIELNKEDKALQQSLIEAFCNVYKIPSTKDLEQILSKNGQTKEELLDKLFYQESLNRLKQIVITPQVLNEAFIQQKASLDMVTFSLIRVAELKVVKELFRKLNVDGEDFAELAMKFSIGPEAAGGGLVSPRPLSQLNPELRSKLQSLQEGQYTEPFVLGDENHLILKLIKLESAKLTPQIEASLREKLFDQWTERQLKLSGFQTISSGASS